ncbi:RNA-directed DNA polymerase, eukaryota [Tanacetum coccineum]
MANRLSFVISNLISDVQSAFVSNRQILDGPFILNELISWCKYNKTKAMIFKVDFEKAFNSVRWDYLDDILDKFSFGAKWRGWIQGCLNSSMGYILVNGVKVGASSSRSSYWDKVLAKISARLSKWKIKTLSIGGRLTLIKSVLTSLTLYHMSLYKAPMGVLNRMESLRRRFFNGVDKNERKISLIGW